MATNNDTSKGGRQPSNEGFQPSGQKGYQPAKTPSGTGKVQGGYQPTTSEAKPNPPPKKP
ncbi:MAG: hypothetical protein ACXWVG_04175 [Telluria sp.]